MPDPNIKLELLYDLIVDNFAILEEQIKELIAQPELIRDTSKFASLLSELKNTTFIDSLLFAISKSKLSDLWLADFLYAVINLLGESSISDEFEFTDELMRKLEFWILNCEDEISWKSASLLKYIETEASESILLKKLEQRGDLFLTYIECILGLLRFDEEKHWQLVQRIAVDTTRDEELRAFCNDLIKNYS